MCTVINREFTKKHPRDEAEANVEVDEESERLRKEEKRQRKEAKRARKAAEAAQEAETDAVHVIEDETTDSEPIKKRKKDKKNKKDRSEEEAAEEMEVTAAVVADETESEAASESKKSKEERKREKELSKESKRMKSICESLDQPASTSSTGGDLANWVPHTATSNMTEEEVLAYRKSVGITMTLPNNADEVMKWKPLTQFDHIMPSLGNHCPEIQAYIKAKKFVTPSAIQAQCWGPLLADRDVIGIASTGSGKTLAFLLPALLKLAKLGPLARGNKNSYGQSVPTPRVLVMAPTRELALQSHDVVIGIGACKGVCIFGGVPKPQQKADLRAGADVVVATPGRLLDLIEEGALNLGQIQVVVLDEADRMLDEGFEPAIRSIIGKCPSNVSSNGSYSGVRQTIMFSATWPEEIRVLAHSFLRDSAIRVTVGSEELAANHRVTQIVEVVQAFEKNKKLFQLLEKYHKSRKNRILIFVLYKKEAVTLQEALKQKGYNAGAIHGDKGQFDRMDALEAFKNGSVPLLIATDVAARGLDIPQVEYVLNYSFPLTVEDYVHRIGRTGRAGASGISHTFFTDFDKGLAGALVGVLQEAGQEVPKEIYQYPLVTKKKTSKLYGDFGPKAELNGQKATKITFDE
jgi:ATP-dependent RNA helicase DBP3